MKIFKLAWANIRKSKSSTTSLLVLVLIASLLLSMGISIITKMSSFYDDKAETLHDAHINLVMNQADYDPAFETYFNNNPEAKEVEEEPMLLMSGVDFHYRDSLFNTNAAMLNADDNRQISPIRLVEKLDTVQSGDIYVSYSFKDEGGYRLGDNITFNYKDQEYSYRIAGFYESTVLNTTDNYVIKFMLPNATYQQLKANLNGTADGAMLSVILQDPTHSTDVLSDFNNQFPRPGLKNYYQTDYETMKSDNSLMINFIAVIMVVFAALIVIVTLIVIRFRVTNMINDGIVNLGVLKALGYTTKQILASITLQLMLITLFSALIGASASTAFDPIFGQMITSFTGLLSEQRFNVLAVVTSVLIVSCLVMLVVIMSAMRIRKLHPVTALRGGLTTHSRKKNRLPLDKAKGGLQFKLACKSMFANSRQNLIILIIMIGITFASVFSVVLYYNIAIDKTTFYHLIGVETNNVAVEAKSGTDSIKLKADIERMNGVDHTIFYDKSAGLVDGQQYNMFVIDDYSKLENQLVFEGRFPQYDNEIALSWVVSDMIHKGIGDTVPVQVGTTTQSMLITGLSSSISNGGDKAFYMTDAGMLKFDPDYRGSMINVYLSGVDNTTFIDAFKAQYGGLADNVTDYDQKIENQSSIYSSAMLVLMTIIIAITVTVVCLILYLVISTMIIKRKKEFGIMKATGYTTYQLMTQIALSYVPVVIGGIVIGGALGCLFTNSMLTMMLTGAGIHNVNFIVKIPVMALLCVGLIVLAYAVSMLVARRIKNISAYGLIME